MLSFVEIVFLSRVFKSLVFVRIISLGDSSFYHLAILLLL